jgi:hypothetical protein
MESFGLPSGNHTVRENSIEANSRDLLAHSLIPYFLPIADRLNAAKAFS